MTTKLAGDLKREVTIGGHAYTVTLSATGFTLALKGRRKGLELKWGEPRVNGEAALATALNASLTANLVPKEDKAPAKRKAKR